MSEELLELIEKTLDEVLPRDAERPSELSAAMRYAVGTGGKRIRPLICLGSALAVGGAVADARYAAAAIELLHNYTLVHDDLPAMDDDVERRGKPTVWKQFGEGNAILVGDALQALAFAAAAKSPNAAAVSAALGRYALGVVQGQVEDIRRESATDRSSVDVDYIYEHKTADLFCAAATMGGYAAGGTSENVERLRRFAFNLGMAFQFEDDLLDGDSPYDREKTEALVERHTAAAVAALAELPGDVSFLSALARRLVGRSA